LAASHRLDLSLLLVNRQVHAEAASALYGGITFLIDADGRAAIRFFRDLPKQAREAITSVAIGGEALLGDDYGSRWSWSGDRTSPKCLNPVPMVTPFGAFLATKLPKLKHAYLYVPFGGTEVNYCTRAPAELEMLLAYRHIERLYYIFFGGESGAALRKYGAVECGTLMLGSANIVIEEHIFDILSPPPKLSASSEKQSRWDKHVKVKAAWVARNPVHVDWKFGDRNIDMGSDSRVQAVLESWLMAKSIREREELPASVNLKQIMEELEALKKT